MRCIGKRTIPLIPLFSTLTDPRNARVGRCPDCDECQVGGVLMLKGYTALNQPLTYYSNWANPEIQDLNHSPPQNKQAVASSDGASYQSPASQIRRLPPAEAVKKSSHRTPNWGQSPIYRTLRFASASGNWYLTPIWAPRRQFLTSLKGRC